MTPDQRAALIACDQHSLLSTADLRRAGLSATQVKLRVRDKGWRRPYRGLVMLPGGPRRSWRRDAMAACLLGGPDARAAALTACALHELVRPPLLPHLSVPPRSSARTKGGRFHRFVVPAVDRCAVDGIPTVSTSRAIVEAASMTDRAGLEELVDQAICSGRATAKSILAALDRAGRYWTGGPLLRSVLAVWSTDIEPGSPAEMRFLRRLVDEWGAEGVETQFEIRDQDGLFVARVDAAIPSHRIVFEYDSDRFHNPRSTPEDEARHARMVALGWLVERASKSDLLPSSTRIRDLLARVAA